MERIGAGLDAYRAFLADERMRILESIRALEQEGRQDEANLNKVRLNITEVFETVAGADERFIVDWEGDPWELFFQRHLPRFSTLTAPWRERLETARRHADDVTIAIEEAKLETAERIERVFRSLKE